jgi:transposase InsO family protein
MKFKMVEELALEQQDVALSCVILEVSPSGYYAWLKRPVSVRKSEDLRLWDKIKLHWEKSRKTYGSPRITEKLQQDGESCGQKRVARIMRKNKIQGAGRKKFRVVTTDSNHKLPIVDRVFQTESREKQVTKPNQYWGGDITYVQTEEGWLFLAIFLDLFTRKVVGHSMKSNMHTQLVLDALDMGLRRQCPGSGLVTHTDRGSQYAAEEYREKLKARNIMASMSRKGNCYDNAMVESFFRTLKVELIYQRKFKTRQEARCAIFEFIEVWYNRQRIHSSLDYKTPVEYELESINKAA